MTGPSPIQNDDAYIGQILKQKGIITERDLSRGLDEQKRTHELLCTVLVRLGFATEESIFSILSLQLGVPFADLLADPPDPEAARVLPASVATVHKCIPFRVNKDVLWLASSDPLHFQIHNDLEPFLHRFSRVKIYLAGDCALESSIRKYCSV